MFVAEALGRSEMRVLASLLQLSTAISGRAVGRITGLSQSTAQRALTTLGVLGLVLAEPAPPSLLYRVNGDHLAMPGLQALLRLDLELRVRIAEEVAGWQLLPKSVVLYGSVARGEAMAGSDVDLLVVRPDPIEPDERAWQQQLAELADHVLRWTGGRASIIDVSWTEAVQGLADREPYLVEAMRDGWLISGEALVDRAANPA
jgi:predicted nucleotidyltransferase